MNRFYLKRREEEIYDFRGKNERGFWAVLCGLKCRRERKRERERESEREIEKIFQTKAWCWGTNFCFIRAFE